MSQHKKKRFNLKTYSKKLVAIIIGVSLFDIQLSYILAFMGRGSIAESLSEQIVIVIVGVVLGYLCKAFFETKEEKKNEILMSLHEFKEREDEI